jgi:hypothetical protein
MLLNNKQICPYPNRTTAHQLVEGSIPSALTIVFTNLEAET